MESLRHRSVRRFGVPTSPALPSLLPASSECIGLVRRTSLHPAAQSQSSRPRWKALLGRRWAMTLQVGCISALNAQGDLCG